MNRTLLVVSTAMKEDFMSRRHELDLTLSHMVATFSNRNVMMITPVIWYKDNNLGKAYEGLPIIVLNKTLSNVCGIGNDLHSMGIETVSFVVSSSLEINHIKRNFDILLEEEFSDFSLNEFKDN